MTDWSVPESTPVPTLSHKGRASGNSVPATMPRLSSSYGYRTDPLLGTGRMHHGLDIPGPLGTPVFASGQGLVTFAGLAGSYGQMVEIDHGGGMRTRYAHLSRLLVRSGEAVGPREAIALMGSTGRSTGSHLHFEVRIDGRATDPAPLLGQPVTMPSVRLASVDTTPHVSDFAHRRAATRDDGIESAN